MTRLTSRDFKKPRSGHLDMARLRDFAVGALTGAALTAVLFGYASRRQHAVDNAAPIPKPQTDATSTADAADEGSQFDFYEMLPKFEVVVPEQERDVKRDGTEAPVQRPGIYVLQAGSYRRREDADRVARQLAVLGMRAQVQRVAVDSDVWHRVRLGPFTDLAELERTRNALREAELDALVIRVGD
ncbi:MAG: SPOR domain-containing protein [Steroidobacteraceae bacterium]